MSTYGYLSALGAGVQALGSIQSGIAASKAAKGQARVSEYNAEVQAGSLESEAQQDEYGATIAGFDADLVRQASSFRERQIRLAGARQQGLNRVAIGASGVTVEGSPLLTLVDNAYQLETNALLARYEGELAAQAKGREAELRRYQAAVRRTTATQVRQAGGFGAALQREQGSTALTAGYIGAASGAIKGLEFLSQRGQPTGAGGTATYSPTATFYPGAPE